MLVPAITGRVTLQLVGPTPPAAPDVQARGQVSPLTVRLITWKGADPLRVTLLLATFKVVAAMVKLLAFSAAICCAMLAWACASQALMPPPFGNPLLGSS